MKSMTSRLIQLFLICLGFALSWSVQAQDQQGGAREPIVGLWLVTVNYGGGSLDYVYSGWTSDGLEVDQDVASPMLTGYVCYGTWIKIGHRKYALTHPYFNYNAGSIGPPFPFDASTLGTWNGTSGYFNYVVTVSEDGQTFTGEQNGVGATSGPWPYGAAPNYTGVTLSAMKVQVVRSYLP
jgi:hypothetical protein